MKRLCFVLSFLPAYALAQGCMTVTVNCGPDGHCPSGLNGTGQTVLCRSSEDREVRLCVAPGTDDSVLLEAAAERLMLADDDPLVCSAFVPPAPCLDVEVP